MKTLARLWIFLALAGLCTAAEALGDGDVFVRVRNAERLHVHLVPLAPFSWRHSFQKNRLDISRVLMLSRGVSIPRSEVIH